MGILRFLGALGFALGLGLAPANAQALRDAKGPVNLPPASFKGPQYIDNRGCAFIRAGRGGQVQWVPRVTRSRQQICGLQPTFAGQRSAVPKTAVRTVKRTVKPQKTRKVRVVQSAASGRKAVRTKTVSVQPSGQLKGPKGANRRIVEARMKTPRGYAPAWEDDRLNPLRGVGTSSGKASMNKVWTQTVPRRLVDKDY